MWRLPLCNRQRKAFSKRSKSDEIEDIEPIFVSAEVGATPLLSGGLLAALFSTSRIALKSA